MSGNDAYGYGYDYSYQSAPNQGQSYYGQYGQPAYNNPTFGSPQTNQAPPQQQQAQPELNFFNNPAAQIGVQFGAQALSAGQQYVNSNVRALSIFFSLYRW